MPTTMDIVKLWYTSNGAPVQVADYPEAASQTFKRGDVVYLVGGLVTVAAAVGANIGNIKILGIADKDASGVTNAIMPVNLATANFRWVIPVTTSGASQAASDADMGVKYEVRRVAAGQWGVDVAATSNAFVIPVKQHPQYGKANTAGLWTGVGSTEAFGWYECTFNQALVDIGV